MKISKPLAFLDLETTSKELNEARIVEIGLFIIHLDGSTEEKQRLINPEVHIPEQATEVHGISDQDVENSPTFKKIAKALYEQLKDCDIAGYNSDKYDIPILSEEFARAGITWPTPGTKKVDVQNLYRHHYRGTLEAVYERLTGNKLEGAHGALADAKATAAVLFRLLEMHHTEETTPEELHDLLKPDYEPYDMAGKTRIDENGELVWTFGNNINRPVLEDLGFFNWVLGPKREGKQDFPEETKRKLRDYQRMKFEEQYGNSTQGGQADPGQTP